MIHRALRRCFAQADAQAVLQLTGRLMQLGLDFTPVQDELVAGVDEGRGPLCGAVVTAAVILDPNGRFSGLNDSKS